MYRRWVRVWGCRSEEYIPPQITSRVQYYPFNLSSCLQLVYQPVKQESRVGFTSSFPADLHLSIHYTSLVDLNSRRAADEQSGFVRWSLPWSRAEGAEGRIPSQQIHILSYVASFETGTCPGSTRRVTLTIGISAPLRPTNRLWSKFSLWIACKHPGQMQAKATCLCNDMGTFPPHSWGHPCSTRCCKGQPNLSGWDHPVLCGLLQAHSHLFQLWLCSVSDTFSSGTVFQLLCYTVFVLLWQY